MVHDYDDDIIELTEVVTEESSQDDQEIIELTQVAPEPDEPLAETELMPEDSLGEELVDSPVVPLEVPAEDPAEDLVPGTSVLDRKTVEAVLEKIIEKKFSETIEKILFEVMEKVIKQEIDDIKTGLKKDLDDI